MDLITQVLNKLKPKARALGFNARELKGIAAKIAGNLTSTDETPEEEVNAEIDERIEAVLPYLTFGQSQANRILDEWKKNHQDRQHDNQDDVQDDQRDDTPAWAKALTDSISALKNDVTAMKSEKANASRKERLDALIKDTGVFGKQAARNFSRMKFETDDDFESYMAEVESDLKEWNQGNADRGLAGLGAPPNTDNGYNSKETLTDAEVEAIAKNL